MGVGWDGGCPGGGPTRSCPGEAGEGDEARPTSVPDGAGVRDRQTSQQGVSLCRLSAPTSLAFLAVCPSTLHPALLISLLLLSQCQVGNCALSRLGLNMRAHTDPHRYRRTWLPSPIAFPAETLSPCTTSQTLPSQAPGVGRGWGCLDRLSPPCPLLAHLPEPGLFPEAPGEDRLKGPRT